MLIHLHSKATTTPKARAAIQASTEPDSVLAERFGTIEQTAYKWKHRDSVQDCSHTPHRLQTTLTPAQEIVAVVLRKTLMVLIDDLLAMVREFLNPEVSRSGLDRCLRRRWVGNLRNLRNLQAQSSRPQQKTFKAYEPRYLHVDVKYLLHMADESSRPDLFVAIDRATRWVFSRTTNPRRQPTPGVFCAIWNGPARWDQDGFDRQWPRVQRPFVRPAQTMPHRQARV